LHEEAQNFKLLSNIKDQKYKIKKHIAVVVLFKTYPVVPLSCRSNLARRYLSFCNFTDCDLLGPEDYLCCVEGEGAAHGEAGQQSHLPPKETSIKRTV
jgi:hypothetical protein